MKLKDQRLVFKMTLLGLSLALYLVLSFASFNLQFMKISLAGLPLIFISVVYGPIEGITIAAVGEFIYQLASFGITPTTVLWMLPAISRALVIGLLFKQKDVKDHKILWIFSVILSGIVVTAINTFVIYIDALVFEYPSYLTLISIALRFVNSIVTSIVYIFLVPFLFEPLIKQGKFDIAK